jgi:hypothetical protein
MPFNHSEAEKIVSQTDVKRYDGRAAALMGDSKPEPKKAPTQPAKPTKGNVVAQQMQTREHTQHYAPVFNKLREAVAAAERACQNPEQGIKSKVEADALLERTLDDLIDVVAEIRDERKVIIRERSAEEQSHPALLG